MVLRNGKALLRALHKQGRQNGQGQRDLQAQRGALGAGAHVHRAANLLHMGAHHVQAYAPPRPVRNRRLGRKTRQVNKVQDFALRHAGGALGREQPLGDGGLGHQRQVYTGAVIGDFDHDHAVFMK